MPNHLHERHPSPTTYNPAFRSVEGLATALYNRARILSLLGSIGVLYELLENDRIKTSLSSPSSSSLSLSSSSGSSSCSSSSFTGGNLSRPGRSTSVSVSIGTDPRNSPIAKLSLEALRKVFVFCLPDARYREPHVRRAPLLLVRVCSLWREAARGTPELWCSLHIRAPSPLSSNHNHSSNHSHNSNSASASDVSARDQDDASELLYHAWLERACGLPLAIAVDARCRCRCPSSCGADCQVRWDAQVCGLMAVFAPRCADLYVVYRHGTRRAGNAALAALLGHAQRAEVLRLDLEDLKGLEEVEVSGGCETALPPRLELRCAVAQVGCLRTLGWRWEALRELRYEPQSRHACEETALVRLLGMCPNLVHLTFDKLDLELGMPLSRAGVDATVAGRPRTFTLTPYPSSNLLATSSSSSSLSSPSSSSPSLASSSSSSLPSSPSSSSSPPSSSSSLPSSSISRSSSFSSLPSASSLPSSLSSPCSPQRSPVEAALVHTSLRSLHVNVHGFVRIAVGLMHPALGVALPHLRLLTVTVHEPSRGALAPKDVRRALRTFAEFLRRSGCRHAQVEIVFTVRIARMMREPCEGATSEAYRVEVSEDAVPRGFTVTRMRLEELSEESRRLIRFNSRPMTKVREYDVCVEFKRQARNDRAVSTSELSVDRLGGLVMVPMVKGK
ncbi:hypothetical protein CONPUDRAFT_167502 [Coniophora puteana RWD-64-598 SS2]|uniref:F-box domain-containing protein n=1 Tax=Coniophora puteana (strain RWD-64-598) TaxID=741705 RepID=A0A5M3MH01_CONPW|nr:uncharacterized protein CONPUDRAFT_167502 [Coniophora puteana RWD-64-598 SS2]EIW78502.1 hypothetical protein CONPUDRAFT_167502 [Coniophora puteana RWD-64-598 SS2]